MLALQHLLQQITGTQAMIRMGTRNMDFSQINGTTGSSLSIRIDGQLIYLIPLVIGSVGFVIEVTPVNQIV